MDFQHYQKMFPSPQQQLYQQQQQQNGFPTPYPQPSFRHHHQQQHPQHHGQPQHSMMTSAFGNPFSQLPKQQPTMNFGGYRNFNNHFMLGPHQQHQQLQQLQQNNSFQCLTPQTTFNLPPLPSTSSFDSGNSLAMTNSPPSLTLSTDGSVKEETPREIFFRTLSSSLKEANKFYSGKTTTWKNPFLYKTNLCDNYCNRQYCRYGVNCWYAHGPHELRCIPESDDLPDPAFISQYLSFLGLPKQTLDQIIQYAYYVSSLLTSPDSPWFASSKKTTSELPSFDSASSITASLSPSKDESSATLPLTSVKTDPINIPKPISTDTNKFYSSLASNGGWGEIESAINGIVDENSGSNENGDETPEYGKSYRLFGESFNAQQPW